jgi:hypothetical protein
MYDEDDVVSTRSSPKGTACRQRCRLEPISRKFYYSRRHFGARHFVSPSSPSSLYRRRCSLNTCRRCIPHALGMRVHTCQLHHLLISGQRPRGNANENVHIHYMISPLARNTQSSVFIILVYTECRGPVRPNQYKLDTQPRVLYMWTHTSKTVTTRSIRWHVVPYGRLCIIAADSVFPPRKYILLIPI